ncbi:MAG: hypothetical protein WEB60_08250 [Terrimicrobiaceae bacterium]
MTTYVYETLTAKKGEKPKHFEIRQSMKDAPLTKHPETGEAIKRVILGGYGLLEKGKSAPSAPKGGCGTGCGCH